MEGLITNSSRLALPNQHRLKFGSNPTRTTPILHQGASRRISFSVRQAALPIHRRQRSLVVRAESNDDASQAGPAADSSPTTAAAENTTADQSTGAAAEQNAKQQEEPENNNTNPLMQRIDAYLASNPDQQLAVAAIALKAFFRGVSELFKLAVFLPLKYLVIAPLSWLLLKMGVTGVNPGDVFDKLEAAHKETPLGPNKLAAVLRSLGTKHPKEVAEFIETRCLNPPPEGPAFPVNAAVVTTYLSALVNSGRIKEYSSDDIDIPPAPGTAHRSLPLLLKELQAAAGGETLSLEPGVAPTRPLHIVLNGGGGGALASSAGGGATGLLATLKSWFWFFWTCAMLSFAWVVGVAAVRRYHGSNSNGMGGMAPGGMPGGSGIAASGINTGGGNSVFGAKEYSKENMPEKSVKSFKDVKGCDEAVAELQEIVAYLKTPDKFTKLGGKLPKGVLLTGQPGTGKTLLARAVAGEAGVPFFYKAGSEFDEMFVGVGSRRVRNLFAAAKKKAPCIVFIDEIDAVGGKRSNWEASGGSRKTLNQLLTEMDGFEDNSGVVVMAATNLHEMLDPALTRPGRFDRTVAVPLPDVNGRKQILDLYLTGKPLASDVDANILARRTPGFSGAQLFNLVNEAALLAARHDADKITSELLDEARDKVLMGSPRALAQSDEARRLTAYHEGGHALVALYTKGAKPIHKATIVPRGHALGMVSQLPDKDEYSTTKQQMVAHIDVCMGGKAAEELIFGEDMVTSGATSDLTAATRLARHMVEDCGMSDKVGPMALDFSAGSSQGDELKKVVDDEVSQLLKSAYNRVANLLKSKESELHTLAAALLEQETLTQAQIKELLWGPQEASTAAGDGLVEGVDAEVVVAAAAAAVDKGNSAAAVEGKPGTAAAARTAAK